MDGLLGLGTTAGQTHSQPDALVALQQHLDLSPSSAQVCVLKIGSCVFLLSLQVAVVAAVTRLAVEVWWVR